MFEGIVIIFAGKRLNKRIIMQKKKINTCDNKEREEYMWDH